MAKKSGKSGSKRAKATNSPKKSKPVVWTETAGPRRLKPGRYQSLKLQQRIKHPVRLPSVWSITKKTALTLWQHKGLFIGITVIYGLLNLVLAQSLSGATDLSSLKHALDQAFAGNFATLKSSLSVFVVLVTSAGNNSSATAGAYQLFIGLIASLAVIWALRQALSGAKIRVRDAYYRGMYPLIPFILVLMVVGLQLIPLVIGSTLYSLVVNNAIAVYAIEKLLWAMLYLLLALLSLYMVSSSLFALYIVTLPDMTPMKALRSARELVRYRRWTVLRKIICLPIILLVVAALIMLPIIVWLTALSQVAFFALSTFGLAAVHGYMYTLYRELLNE